MKLDDLKTGKKQQSTMDIVKFARQVLVHLPPKNFKMVILHKTYLRQTKTSNQVFHEKYFKT